ncbi:MAG TPA: hypothetical protein VMU33_17830 [Burkholderiaceae bacterium]|nr:hypothetical protein [Burkholderiaceae bacterium]
MPATDFAITTVNFPDRLDVREVNDRQIEDDHNVREPRFDSYVVGQWLKRFAAVAILAGAVYGLFLLVRPLLNDLAAPQLAARLSRTLGQQVKVQSSGFRVSPSPRVTINGVDVGDQVHLDEVALTINWPEAIQALRGARWTGGEAVVSPSKFTMAQASQLLAVLPRLKTAFPASIATVRFESVQITDAPMLPGRYEVVSRRTASGAFEVATVHELGIDGTMDLKLTPAADSDRVAFALDATNWRAPYRPKIRWSEVNSTGTFAPHQIDATFSISAFYGVTQGSVSLAQSSDGEDWILSGKASGANLDVDAIVGQAMGREASSVAKGDASIPVTGTATMNLALAGRGSTPDMAVRTLAAAGPLQIRWATLNGINLGYVATRPAPGGALTGPGGSTRFTDLEAMVVADASSLTLKDIDGRAGAMSTRGQITVADDNSLSGNLRVDLGASRVQAPLFLRVSGKVEKPLYGG